ncbi:hypothetical protein DYB37_006279 [Aphanomyces astaci]|uniref:CBS domain-containing protein n=2 Tax=Aphanomyces astaci TaxID=112090 RepID=A0A3R6WLZ5_APHAT|nr:hypothetical protein DYB35_002458 [Aphanomyces astaci]RHZ26442.1 hypothetical protein DYB37_006279 [Aphanomyces astaci]
MVQRNIGSLIVTQENQGVVGIVTERDILVKGKETAEHEELAVKDIMSKRILALATMNKEKIRHLAVVHTDPSQPAAADSVPIEAMRSVLSIKVIPPSFFIHRRLMLAMARLSDPQDIIKAYAEDKKQELTDPTNTATSSEATPPIELVVVVNASTLLRKKHETINLILNTRLEDNVSVAEAVAEMVLHPKLDASQVLTKDVCTRSVWTLKSDDSLHTCVFEAATRNFHHFPVVDAKEEIVGLLSVKDIVHEIVSEVKPTTGFWLMEYFKKAKQPAAAPAAEKVEAAAPPPVGEEPNAATATKDDQIKAAKTDDTKASDPKTAASSTA